MEINFFGKTACFQSLIELTRLELLTFLYSLQVLLESGNEEKAKEIITKVIKEAETDK